MDFLEKNKIKNFIEIINEIHNGKNKIEYSLEFIENNSIKNGWIIAIFNEAKKILQADVDLKNSTHIKHLINLLNDVLENGDTKEYMMYKHPSWYELIKLRSPFEFFIEIRRCSECKNEYPFQAIGDFADIGIFNCSKCDKILVGTLYAAKKELKCKKEGFLVFNKCPKCKSLNFEKIKSVNPYYYFSNHTFINNLDEC